MAAAKKAASKRPPSRPRPGESNEEFRARRNRAIAENGPVTERTMVRLGPTTAELMNDPDLILSWDDEELRRGYRRNKAGVFDERNAPEVIPRAVYNELWRRTIATCNEMMRTAMPEAIAVLIELAKSDKVKDADRIKAIQMIMDRVLGKVPEKVLVAETEAGAKPKWANALDVSIVSGDEGLD